MLKSEKIIIRAIEKTDLSTIAAWRSDPDMYDYFYEFLPISTHQQERWYEQQLANRDEINFAVADHEGKLIGTVSIYHIDRRNRKAEWGRLIIGDKNCKGKGIGKEIERLVIQYAFDHLNLHKLYCEVIVSNDKVIAMHHGFGFQREAIFKDHVFKSGVYIDVVSMALLETAYRGDSRVC
jgi:UDP-4-amino-4,6-dideoxy-N-acetyl-beta-L-altrosamine N-acetyltransferase